MYAIREYRPADERQWLECRPLPSFFGTDYYDDVKTAKTVAAGPGDCASSPTRTAGCWGSSTSRSTVQCATIDSIAVRPGARRRGIAGALLGHAIRAAARPDVLTLDAWTRENTEANGWYQRSGFAENHRYLHVYKGWEESARRV